MVLVIAISVQCMRSDVCYEMGIPSTGSGGCEWTEEKRALLLPLWAALVSVVVIYFLTENYWKALLIATFVAGSAMLQYGPRWVLMGSFAKFLLSQLRWAFPGRINGCNWPTRRKKPFLLLEPHAESLLGGCHLNADGPAAST